MTLLNEVCGSPLDTLYLFDMFYFIKVLFAGEIWVIYCFHDFVIYMLNPAKKLLANISDFFFLFLVVIQLNLLMQN